MVAAFADVPNGEELVRLVLTLPALFIVLGSPVAGWIVDRYGRKKLLVACIAVYGFAGIAPFFTTDLNAILVERALVGLMVAGIITSVTTLITDYHVGSARARVLGIQAGAMGLMSAIALSLAGMLALYRKTLR